MYSNLMKKMPSLHVIGYSSSNSLNENSSISSHRIDKRSSLQNNLFNDKVSSRYDLNTISEVVTPNCLDLESTMESKE
jgi:hypothetical protein